MVLSNLSIYNFSSDFSIESYKTFAVDHIQTIYDISFKSVWMLPTFFIYKIISYINLVCKIPIKPEKYKNLFTNSPILEIFLLLSSYM